MPLEVKIPKEITEYREKIMFGMSVRQLVTTLLAIAIATPSYFFVRKYIGNDLSLYLVLIEAMPIMGVGFLRVNGFTFEKYIMIILRHWFSNSKRFYKAEVSVDTLDYYSDFGLGVSVSEELITKAKKEKYSRVRSETTDQKVARNPGQKQKAKSKAA